MHLVHGYRQNLYQLTKFPHCLLQRLKSLISVQLEPLVGGWNL